MNPESDDWINAFDEQDFEDPQLAAMDEAVERLAHGRAPVPQPSANTHRWWIVGLTAAAAAAGLVWLASAPEPVAEQGGVAPAVATQGAPLAIEAPTTAVAEHRPATETVEAVDPAEVPLETPDLTDHRAGSVPDTPWPELPKPGLIPEPGTEVVIAGSTAILSTGTLHYVHDAEHDPGVRSVALKHHPLQLVPVGTAFTVRSDDLLAAVRVQDGKVQLTDTNGSVVDTIAKGDERLIVSVPEAKDGLQILDTTELSLNEVVNAVPAGCLCRPADVVAQVATLRLLELQPNR